jgi:hypothetical protein
MENFMKNTYFLLSLTLLASGPALAMEKESKQLSEYLTILNSAMPLFMRVREGCEPNIQVIKNDASESRYTITGNQETFSFPENTKIRIKLNSTDWPLRLRWWAAQDRPDLGIREYLPTPDIDKNGIPTKTSDANAEHSILSLILSEEEIIPTDDRYLELYMGNDNEVHGTFSAIEPRKKYTQIPVIRAGYGKNK